PTSIEERIGGDEEREPPVRILRCVAGPERGDRQEDERGEENRARPIEPASRERGEARAHPDEQERREEELRIAGGSTSLSDRIGDSGQAEPARFGAIEDDVVEHCVR